MKKCNSSSATNQSPEASLLTRRDLSLSNIERREHLQIRQNNTSIGDPNKYKRLNETKVLQQYKICVRARFVLYRKNV